MNEIYGQSQQGMDEPEGDVLLAGLLSQLLAAEDDGGVDSPVMLMDEAPEAVMYASEASGEPAPPATPEFVPEFAPEPAFELDSGTPSIDPEDGMEPGVLLSHIAALFADHEDEAYAAGGVAMSGPEAVMEAAAAPIVAEQPAIEETPAEQTIETPVMIQAAEAQAIADYTVAPDDDLSIVVECSDDNEAALDPSVVLERVVVPEPAMDALSVEAPQPVCDAAPELVMFEEAAPAVEAVRLEEVVMVEEAAAAPEVAQPVIAPPCMEVNAEAVMDMPDEEPLAALLASALACDQVDEPAQPVEPAAVAEVTEPKPPMVPQVTAVAPQVEAKKDIAPATPNWVPLSDSARPRTSARRLPEDLVELIRSIARASVAQPETGGSIPSAERYVVFRLEPWSLAFQIKYVREVERVGRLTPVPGAPGFVCGLLNLRGEVLPLIDLRSLLGLGDSNVTGTGKMVVVQFGRSSAPCALMVDELGGIAALEPSPLPPDAGQLPPDLIRSVSGASSHRGRHVLLVDPRSLLPGLSPPDSLPI